MLREMVADARARAFPHGGQGGKAQNSRVSVSRKDKLIGEYNLLQLGSLLETGYLLRDDLCRDPKTNETVPLRKFLDSVGTPGFSRKPGGKMDVPDGPNHRSESRRRGGNKKQRARILQLILVVALAIAAALWVMKTFAEVTSLKQSLAKAEAENSELKQKYQNVLFAAREVAATGQVRGRVILRDASGKRASLPGIRIRLFSRAAIEAHLSDRHASIAEAEGTDPWKLSVHFLKNIPLAIETTATDSDGRFEFKIPVPGEYVIQTGIRSEKTGEMRLWFVAFDSRDPLNTAVDITESNVVRQFHPLLMLVDGR